MNRGRSLGMPGNVKFAEEQDFTLQAYEHQETRDFYEILVERHRRASLVVVCNREPKEWLATMADPRPVRRRPPPQPRLRAGPGGDSFRGRQKPARASAS